MKIQIRQEYGPYLEKEFHTLEEFFTWWVDEGDDWLEILDYDPLVLSTFSKIWRE